MQPIKRFLSSDSIKKAATNNTFEEFCRYMTLADSIITEDSWSTDFYIEFMAKPENQKQMYETLLIKK
jgi:hypothetical protein